ncbi:MAG: NADH-quinone oxidoreductase subunit J [Bacteroidetes bacterium]|jgi:NADH-quinone oxidoreductase subunit J|nr:NADH-quinone oxidoreductase subunit J [Bacteroidota bacterium]
MNWYNIVFYAFAALTVISAIGVVFSRSILYAAFSLLFTFFGVAALYVLLSADFIAITQILLYVGGILVLIIFGIMLTSRANNVEVKRRAIQLVPAVLVVGVIAGTLIGVLTTTNWPTANFLPYEDTARPIGALLMTQFVLPFELASILLLVALIGAVIIARREKGKRA